MKLSTLFLLLALFATSSNAFAADVWTGAGTVNVVTSHEDWVVIETSISTPACTGLGKFYWDVSLETSSDMLTLATAALLAGKAIRVVFDDDGGSTCRFGAERITHLKLHN